MAKVYLIPDISTEIVDVEGHLMPMGVIKVSNDVLEVLSEYAEGKPVPDGLKFYCEFVGEMTTENYINVTNIAIAEAAGGLVLTDTDDLSVEPTNLVIISLENPNTRGILETSLFPADWDDAPGVTAGTIVHIGAYYEESDKKPDNIDIHTASKNRVVESTHPAQVRSQVNWMDRLERIIIDRQLRVETVDEKARSVEKYLDAIQGRKNFSPIIRKTKDIERPESDSQDDNVEEVTN